MKIGLTTTSFRWDQGAERFVVNLAKGLLTSGHEVHVIGRLEKSNILDEFLEQLSPDQQNRFFFHRVKTIKATKYLNLITFAYAVHRVLKRHNFDVVQGFGKSLGLDVFRPPTGTHKAFLSAKKGKPNREPCTLLEYAIEKRLLFEQVKVLVVNSNLSLKRVRRAYPGITTPSRVIPNMVDLKYWQTENKSGQRNRLRSEWQLREDDIVFLHVSTSFVSKGVPEILEAYDRLKSGLSPQQHNRIKLVLVGDKSYRIPEKYKQEIRIYPRTNDVRPFFYAADVLMHPTRFDSFANVVLESLACGLPVVTTRYNGAIDAITDGSDGYIINEVDADDIAGAISFFLDDNLRMEMSRSALKKSEQFSPERITEQYVQLYETLAPQIKLSKKNLTLWPWELFKGLK
ncbi:glycosyltransferase family 4 protein [bacterium]|nr:glycosyltransferase family 4 protein [bacterium]